MTSYAIYQESFSFRNLFFKRKTQDDLKKRKREALQPARANFIKLKELLKSRGYSIKKSNDPGDNYHVRKDMEIRLSSHQDKWSDDITFLKVLFTLAHETGHALQWSTEVGMKTRLQDKMEEMYDWLVENKPNANWTNMEEQDPKKWNELQDLYDFWYELDAWIKGLAFIPTQYHNAYKKYAKRYYSSYITPTIKKHWGNYILELRMLDYNKY